MFHLECTCHTITHEPAANGLVRCHRCHGHKIQRIIIESAKCRQCRKPATIVCAVCLYGMHQTGECILGHGVQQACIQLSNEKISVCTDCAWRWVDCMSKGPCKKYTEQAAEAIAIIDKDAIITCPRRREAFNAIQTYI